MNSKMKEVGDEANTSFGFPEQVADHKPGFDNEVRKQEVETGDDRRFRPSKKKDVPQQSLANRIDRNRKGG